MITHNNIFVWNCRGSNAFYRYCNQYIRMHKPKVVVIMEIRCDPKKVEPPLKRLGFDKKLVFNNNGYVGGIVIAWQSCSFNIEEIIKISQFLHVVIQEANMNEWYFTAVYASPSDDRRKMLWEDLKNIANGMTQPWLVAGDFNDIASIA